MNLTMPCDSDEEWTTSVFNADISMTDVSWRVAAACNNGACVKVAAIDGGIAIADSKSPDGPVLVYTHDEWLAFLNGAKEGDFDDLIGTGQSDT
jgi:Domain of unknown function (DUF397)